MGHSLITSATALFLMLAYCCWILPTSCQEACGNLVKLERDPHILTHSQDVMRLTISVTNQVWEHNQHEHLMTQTAIRQWSCLRSWNMERVQVATSAG